MSPIGISAISASTMTRVMVVAPRSSVITGLVSEIARRDAACVVIHDANDAYAQSRKSPFQLILVYAREGVAETLLLLQLLKTHAQGQPRVVLLVHPDHAYSYALAASPADAMFSSLMSPSRILDVAGIFATSSRGFAPVLNPAPELEVQPIKLLILPQPLHVRQLPTNTVLVRCESEIPDAVIITRADGFDLMRQILAPAVVAVVPIIDLTHTLKDRSDVSAPYSRFGIEKALEEIAPLIATAKNLPDDYFKTINQSWMLLAHMAVRQCALMPVRDVNVPTLYRYSQETLFSSLSEIAESLIEDGLLTKALLDRVQCCPECHSARVQVREECAACRSINISDTPLIHHFACGYHGTQNDFTKQSPTENLGSIYKDKQSGLLRVSQLHRPKCAQELTQYGGDYDTSGQLIVYEDCGHEMGESAVGFMCMDCHAHTTAEKMQVNNVYQYSLTSIGQQAAFKATADYFKDNVSHDIRTETNTPASQDIRGLHRRVSQFAREQKAREQDYAVLMIRLDVAGKVRRDSGDMLWRESVALFGRLLRERFTSQIDIIQRHDVFLVLLDQEQFAHIKETQADLKQSLEKPIRIDLKVEYVFLGAGHSHHPLSHSPQPAPDDKRTDLD
jgi:hypothetical protein